MGSLIVLHSEVAREKYNPSSRNKITCSCGSTIVLYGCGVVDNNNDICIHNFLASKQPKFTKMV